MPGDTTELRVGELVGAMRGLETGFADFKADVRLQAQKQDVYHHENQVMLERLAERVGKLERWKVAVVAAWTAVAGLVAAFGWLFDRLSKIAELVR